ncbi:hypothetical protein J4232_02505 [Candidatus Woesearchaeota archaeon]|nr:hypothetical protein [Candidatus Woesearchaeota archaeon]
MDDNQIRILILEFLKNSYDKNPHSYIERKNIIERLNIIGNELDRNIKYLEQKGLIDAEWFLGGSFITKINSYGIDAIDNIKSELIKQEIIEETLPNIINETKLYVDSKLKLLNEEILVKLDLIYDDLKLRDDTHTFSRVAYDCREILFDFTDALFKEEYLRDNEQKPTRNQTKNKLRFIVRSYSNSITQINLISERYDYIINYFNCLNDFIQKNAHPDGFKVTREDANSCLIYTYLFMRDILKITELEE